MGNACFSRNVVFSIDFQQKWLTGEARMALGADLGQHEDEKKPNGAHRDPHDVLKTMILFTKRMGKGQNKDH